MCYYYASVGRAPETYGSRCVSVSFMRISLQWLEIER